MIFISNKKKIKLGKLIAATKHIAVHSIGETDKKTQIENMSKIVENLATGSRTTYGFMEISVLCFAMKHS